MIDGLEFWQASVFSSRTAEGNQTGIVFESVRNDEITCQLIARALGFPDTVFLSFANEWQARTFSPWEQISFCVQTLLAAHVVLREKAGSDALPESWFRVGETRAIVRSDSLAPGISWLTIPAHQIVIEASAEQPDSIIGNPVRKFPALVIDSGRKRVYQLVPRDELHSIVVQPREVLQFCRERSIHGICLMALTGEREIALRVFTTSLDGREDIATGGAVAGIFSYLEQIGMNGFHSIWHVQQGSDGLNSRGALYVRRTNEHDVEVGGVVKLLVRGKLWKGLEKEEG